METDEHKNYLQEYSSNEKIVGELLRLDSVINESKNKLKRLKSYYLSKNKLYRQGDHLSITNNNEHIKTIVLIGESFTINNGKPDICYAYRCLGKTSGKIETISATELQSYVVTITNH